MPPLLNTQSVSSIHAQGRILSLFFSLFPIAKPDQAREKIRGLVLNTLLFKGAVPGAGCRCLPGLRPPGLAWPMPASLISNWRVSTVWHTNWTSAYVLTPCLPCPTPAIVNQPLPLTSHASLRAG